MESRLGLNPQRGEVGLMIEGVERRLCLTLGALAEIEAGLGCQSLAELAERTQRLSVRDVRLVLGALLRGGGEHETASRLDRCRVDLPAAARAIAEAMS